MRVLFSCLPGSGHFHPLVPLARALTRAGHRVTFATASDMGPRVEAAGFEFHATGLSITAQIDVARRRYPEADAIRDGRRRFEEFVPRMLAGVAAPARAADLVPLVERWQPDVIVHDEAELAAPLAGLVAGIPWASQSVVLRRPVAMANLSAEVIAPLAERYGVDLSDRAGLFRYLHLDACPPALQPADAPVIPVAHLVRNTDDADTARGDELPAWVADLPGRAVVYVTLGTLFRRNRDVLAALIEGVAREAVTVIATVGAENVTALGPQPPNVHLADYVPLSWLLPHLDVVVTQGGTSILPALAAGLPLLVAPQGADQFHNADACVAAGVGLALPPGGVTPEAVAGCVRRLLTDRDCRTAARHVADEIAAMPGPERGVALLERLAAERRPLTDANGG